MSCGVLLNGFPFKESIYLKYRNSQAGDSVRKTIRVSLIVDGRNIYDQNELADKGFRYTRIGKKLAE